MTKAGILARRRTDWGRAPIVSLEIAVEKYFYANIRTDLILATMVCRAMLILYQVFYKFLFVIVY